MIADFYNWNRVKIRYCDGASFAGDGEDNVRYLFLLTNFLSYFFLPPLIHLKLCVLRVSCEFGC